MHELVAWLFEAEQGLSHFLNNLISEHLCCHWFRSLLLPFEVPQREISSVKEVLLRKILNISRDGIQKMFPPQEDSVPSYTPFDVSYWNRRSVTIYDPIPRISCYDDGLPGGKRG